MKSRFAAIVGTRVDANQRLINQRLLSRVASFTVSGVIVCAGFSSLANAETGVIVGAGVEYTDNVRREPSPVDDTIVRLNAGAFYQNTTPDYEGRIAGDITARRYLGNTFGDEISPTLDALFNWKISPERFTWMIQDRMRQVTTDPLQTDTPANRQTSNILETGPDVRLRLSSVDTAAIEARWARTNYFDTPDRDNDKAIAALRWLHRTSANNEISLNSEAGRIQFNQATFESYLRYDAYIGINNIRPHSTIQLSAGGSLLDRDASGEIRGHRSQLVIEYRPNSSSDIALNLENGFSDLSADILYTPSGGGLPGALAADLFYQNRAVIRYNRRWTKSRLNLNFGSRTRDYQGATSDEIAHLGGLEISTDFDQRLVGTLIAGYTNTSYLAITPFPRVDNELLSAVRTSYQFRKNWEWLSELRLNQRHSDDAARNYTERVIFTGLNFRRSSGLSPAPVH